MAKITVLMSVYAKETPEYFRRALRSIWHDQTRKPDEVVLVEDGPLPETLNTIVNEISREVLVPFIILKNASNEGLTKSLNRGAAVASGDYVARMDSDDISLPQRFSHQLEYMESHPEIGVLGGSIQEFNEENSDLGVRTYPRTQEEMLKYIYRGSPLAHPSVMIRKSAVFDRGLNYNENYRTSQDIALWYDCLCNGVQLSNLDEVILKFRRDDKMLIRRGHEKARNELHIYMDGIRRVYGMANWRNIYPLARFMFRMMPSSLVKMFYDTGFRQKLLHGRGK